MAQTSIQKKRQEEISNDRKTIRETVDVFKLLAEAAAGYPLVEYEPRANKTAKPKVKRYVHLSGDQRLRAMDILARRLLPELRQVGWDEGDGKPLQISINVPFALPGQQQAGETIEGTVTPYSDSGIGRLDKVIEDAVEASDGDED